MLKKISTVALTAALAFSMSVASFSAAQARRHHGGAVAGALVGGLALGVLASEAARDRDCYRECRWVRGSCWRDDYGDRVCRPGRRECYRVCD